MTLWSTNWQLSHKKLQDFDELQTGVIVQIPTCLLPYVNLSSSYDTSFKELRIDFVINNQHFSKYSQTKAAKKQKKKKLNSTLNLDMQKQKYNNKIKQSV